MLCVATVQMRAARMQKLLHHQSSQAKKITGSRPSLEKRVQAAPSTEPWSVPVEIHASHFTRSLAFFWTMASLSDIISINDLELSEAQADIMSTAGFLLAFFGVVTAGSSILSMISTMIGVSAVSSANDLRLRIAEERLRRFTTTTEPTTTTTTLDPSKKLQN